MPSRKTPAASVTTETAVDLQEKMAWVCDQLDAEYGVLQWRSHGEPLATLVQTILSQATSDRNSDRAFDSLRHTFPTWDDVRTAPAEVIADTIRSGGLADAKAPRIKEVLGAIHAKTGATNLDFMWEMPTEDAKQYLSEFHGVGPKTVACVMMFSLCRPVLPVDTHVFRVSHRLGLIEKKIGEAKAHKALEALVPPERVYPFHVHMIRHGRRVCIAQRPRCSVCTLAERCDYYKEGGPMATIAAPKEDIPDTFHGLSAV